MHYFSHASFVSELPLEQQPEKVLRRLSLADSVPGRLASISTEVIFGLELGRTLRNPRGIPRRWLAISITEKPNPVLLPITPLPAADGVTSQQVPEFTRVPFLAAAACQLTPLRVALSLYGDHYS